MSMERLTRLISGFAILGIDALFVSDPVNIRYLTGYAAEDAWLLVTRKKTFYVTDFRYEEQVKKSLKDINVIVFGPSLYAAIMDLCVSAKVEILGFEEQNMTFYAASRLKAVLGKLVKFKALSGAVESFRLIKDPAEIQLIRKAIAVNCTGFRYIAKYIKPGVSERFLLHKLQDFARKCGADFSFNPIIASGPNSAYPHARVTDRVLRPMEPLLLDFGLQLEGYKSDLTRMFFLGKMPRSFLRVLSLIKETQKAAFAVIKPGVAAKDVDKAARDVLASSGLDSLFGHSLGHGVGLNIHELPRLSSQSGDVLIEGMVVTVEPGVYFPGKYGVRQEEMVLVTKNGCEVLSADRDNVSS